MNKKAIGAIFAWIFILIAGALIITVFTIIATGQGESAQNKLHLQALQNVNTILATQQTTGDVMTSIDIPRNELRIVCTVFEQDDSLAALNQLEIGGFSQSLETQLVVGRDMQTDELSLFSKRWSAPFAVGNILYVSSPDELLFYESASDELAERFVEMVPENIQPRRGTADTIDAARWQNVRVVVIGESAPNAGTYETRVNRMQPGIVYAHVATQDDFASGTVTFYGLSETGGPQKHNTYHFVGEEMMLAYIWQGDDMRASCLQNKLAQRLRAQTQLQLERMKLLREQYSSSNDCKYKYLDTPITDVQDALKLTTNRFPDGALYDFSALKEEVDALEKHNELLLRGDPCATIY